jgi:hypothetical protein
LIYNGASGVVATELPISTPDVAVDFNSTVPVPAAASVRFPFDVVVIVDAPPFPTLIVPPDAPKFSVVAAPAKLSVVAVPLNNASVVWFVVIVDAPFNAKLDAVVIVPSELAVSVEVLIASVPAVFSVPKEFAFSVDVPFSVTVPALTVNNPFPFPGLIAMFPVLPPPIVKVVLFRLWIVDVAPFNDNPFGALPVTADILATGVLSSTPVNANSALVVALEPSSRSSELCIGDNAPPSNCQ